MVSEGQTGRRGTGAGWPLACSGAGVGDRPAAGGFQTLRRRRPPEPPVRGWRGLGIPETACSQVKSLSGEVQDGASISAPELQLQGRRRKTIHWPFRNFPSYFYFSGATDCLPFLTMRELSSHRETAASRRAHSELFCSSSRVNTPTTTSSILLRASVACAYRSD